MSDGAAPPPNRFWRPELDGLRFVAFLAVFVSHALPASAARWDALGPLAPLAATAVKAGAWGVDLFFLLSAYLITELLRREWDATGTIALGRFWARRCLRIWPLYYAFLALHLLVLPHLGFAALPKDHAVAYLLFGGNWATVWWGAPGTVSGHLWSVSIEEQFYLAWPLLLLAPGRRRWTWLLAAAGVAAVATRILLGSRGAGHLAFWNNTFVRLDPIVMGAALSLVLGGRTPAWTTARRLALGGVCMLVLASMGLVLPAIERIPTWVTQVRYPAVALLCAGLLVSLLGVEDGPLRRVFASRSAVYLGRISYGLYVFHILGIEMAQHLVGNRGRVGPFAAWQAVGLLLTVAMAALSYRFLEEPFLRLKERFAVVKSRAP